ncbi:MAG: hypothetical protein K6B69_15330 [Lachnospiraceae bacterium]|nr:hypothetical protein [Lachnospiraceae bacterium]
MKSQIYRMQPRRDSSEDYSGIRILSYFVVLPLAFFIMAIVDNLTVGWCIFILLFYIFVIVLIDHYYNRKVLKNAYNIKNSLVIDRDKKSGRWEFQPERIPAMITWDREEGITFSNQENNKIYYGSYNVVLIRDKSGWTRIYGSVDVLIVEIGLRKKKDFEIFHMTDPEITDTVIPFTDEKEEKALILRNPYSERFVVKEKWMVSEQRVCDFLNGLYETQEIEKAMQGFDFEDTTELVHRLIDKKCYVVPDERVYDFDDMQQDKVWMGKTEKQLQDALEEMQK